MQTRINIFENKFAGAWLIFGFALSVVAVWLILGSGAARAQEEAGKDKSQVLRNAEAGNRLKENGQYDSLTQAYRAARQQESVNSPEDLSPTAKLAAADGAPPDFFGYSVAVSGNTAIVGAPLGSLETAGQTNTSQGAAYVFTRSGAIWSLQQKLTASDGAARDSFGVSVSLEGNTAVVGAYLDDVGSNANQGSAYVFTRSGTNWTEQAKLTAAQGAAGDRFGISAEISGETIVVGTKLDQGAAYVFTRSGAAWTQQQRLTPSSGAAGDEFGGVVTINGETILVSATGRFESGGDNQGAVYVFVRSGGVWSEQQKLTAPDGAADDRFGSDIALAGNTAVIGAFQDDTGANSDQGSAYIFTRSGAAWTQQQKLTASDGAAGDRFGASVAISGATAIVGASGTDNLGLLANDAGAAYVFTSSGATWSQQAKLALSGGNYPPHGNERLGSSIALDGDTVVAGVNEYSNSSSSFFDGEGTAFVFFRSGTSWSIQYQLSAEEEDDGNGEGLDGRVAIDGDTAIVGSPSDTIGANVNQGSAYIFVRSGAAWTFQQKITAPDGAAFDYFGNDVGISGDTVIAGTGYDNTAYDDTNEREHSAEAAYVFVRSGGTWTGQQKLTASDATVGDGFGETVAVFGDTIVVGAPAEEYGTSVPNGFLGNGSAYVFARSNGTWTEQQKLNTGQSQGAFHYAQSVAVSNDSIFVGVPYQIPCTGSGCEARGYVYVYTRSGATWMLQQRLTDDAGAGAACDLFGYEVAVSGNSLIARTQSQPASGAGCTIFNNVVNVAYTFNRSGTSWSPPQKLSSSVGADSVAISGDTAVVGLSRETVNSKKNQGTAYVYSRSGTNWSRTQILTAPDGATNDFFGSDVAVSGSTIIVGAQKDDVYTNNSEDIEFLSSKGSAYVFEFTGVPTCSFTLNPTGGSFTSAGGTGSFSVIASNSICDWTAVSDSPWLTVTSGGSGSGNGTVSYSVAANQTSSPRTGTISVGGQIFTVTQAGVIGTGFTVTNTNDSGAGSLRDAITQANSTSESRTIIFDSTIFNQPRTITLTSSNLYINTTNGGTITITGPGANLLTVSGANARRVLTIRSNSVVNISGMTLTNGNGSGSVSSGNGGAIYNNADLTLSRVVVSGSASGSGSDGGGIFHTLRGLTLDNCVVSGSTTSLRGGGIYLDFNVTATLSASTVSNNMSSGFGGGIYSNSFSTLTLTGSNITGNTTQISSATDGGGGIYSASDFTMSNSTVSGNKAPNGSGGGIGFSNSGIKTITASTISGNTAGGSGGGLNFSNTQITVTNSTISGNRANGSGGGINRNNASSTTQAFNYMTIAGNSAANSGGGVTTQAAMSFNNSIIGNNNAATSPDFAGTLNSGGYNLIKDTTGATITGTTTGNLTGVDPRLDLVLRNNGGATGTLALRPDSPAIDAGNPSNPPATDQRSLPRPIDGDGNGAARSDIGSYERQANDRAVFAPFDFDADGKADVSVYRPSDGNWYAMRSGTGFSAVNWGISGDKPAPADYDGDGKTDLCVFRDNGLGDPNKSYFFIFRSSDNTVQSIQFGRVGDDPSVVGDWDGDGKADVAVFRAGANAGEASYFYYHPSSQPATAFVSVPWGTNGDKQVVGDYDGDGKLDAAVFRPSNAVWYILRSSNGTLQANGWGVSTDKPLARDFDGDGKTDLTVFRDGNWYVLQSANNQFQAISWGLGSDTLVPADYDGDGKADAAVFRNGVWYVLRSSDNQVSITNFGLGTDTPLPSIY